MTTIQIKRIYEPAAQADGFRMLVDRLWPRGVKKESAKVEVWMKEIAPSSALRKWFNHDPEKWTGFCQKYQAELSKNETVSLLMEHIHRHQTVTLLYGAHDEQHNQALVLLKFINGLSQ